jgi:hypothetical protein
VENLSILICNYHPHERNQVGSVGIATGYELDGRGNGVRVPVGARLSFLHVVQTGSQAHPASSPMDTEGSFLGGKAPTADHSSATSAEVKNTWIYTSSPPIHLHSVVLN